MTAPVGGVTVTMIVADTAVGGRYLDMSSFLTWNRRARELSGLEAAQHQERQARRPSLSLIAPAVKSEVEGQAGRDGLDGRPADRVVGGIPATDLIAVAARPETIVRAGLVLE